MEMKFSDAYECGSQKVKSRYLFRLSFIDLGVGAAILASQRHLVPRVNCSPCKLEYKRQILGFRNPFLATSCTMMASDYLSEASSTRIIFTNRH